MRGRILERIYTGTVADCQAVPAEWAVIHACRNPCYCNKCGTKPDPQGPHYLSFKDGNHLYLNIIDPKEPLFQKRLFLEFMAFMRTKWEEGRHILIHCNQGNSRAPSLALVFLAKVLHRITNRSYDDAWEEFEHLIRQKYEPGQGIEMWLRKHWDELGEMAPPKAPPVDPHFEQEPGKIPDDPASGVLLVRTLPIVHFAGFTKIEDKEHRWINPVPNSLQHDINEAYAWCMEMGIPCRLIILKPRQVGCSTVCGHICYHHMRRIQSDMVMMADVSKRTEKVWQIFNDMSLHDSFGTNWGSTYEYNTIRGVMRYPDGTSGLVEHDTALDSKAGVSGTRQIVWMSEAARFMKTGGRDKKVITAMLNSLANVPNSLGIAESTPEGSGGWFYETWQGAVTLDQMKQKMAGNKDIKSNGWIQVFAAWFEFKEHSLEENMENLGYFYPELDHREVKGKNLYNWTMPQIAWRRMKISKDCGGDARMFDQDFAEDAEGCFLASGRPRFDMQKVGEMERRANMFYPLGKYGSLDRVDTGALSFTERKDGSAWLWLDEKPVPGRSYMIPLDPCQGEQSEGSDFPDSHAVLVIRKGFMDGNRWMPHKVVAAIDVPTGCRWENRLIAERAKAMSDWYGECIIIPETGNGLGIIEALRNVGAYVYKRQKMDAMYPGRGLEIPGWETTYDTRAIAVDAIADAITQEGLECNFLPAVLEMKVFVINDRGTARAKHGKHDDFIMALGIGLANIDFATVMPDSSGGGFGGAPVTGGGGPGPTVGGISGRALS